MNLCEMYVYETKILMGNRLNFSHDKDEIPTSSKLLVFNSDTG